MITQLLLLLSLSASFSVFVCEQQVFNLTPLLHSSHRLTSTTQHHKQHCDEPVQQNLCRRHEHLLQSEFRQDKHTYASLIKCNKIYTHLQVQMCNTLRHFTMLHNKFLVVYEVFFMLCCFVVACFWICLYIQHQPTNQMGLEMEISSVATISHIYTPIMIINMY